MKRRKILVFLAILLMLLASSGVARATSYFVYDQWGGSWCDANKTGSGDSMMCWAAAASNILAWAGYDTPTYNTQNLIFQYFVAHWTNAGSLPQYGWNWFLDGTLPPNWSGWSQVKVPGGNFWPADNFSDLYYQASGGNLMANIASFFQSGDGVTLAIYKPNGGHALTCWGYDYSDLNGVIQYTGVWVTDSDDGVTALKEYPVSWDSTNYLWDLGGAYRPAGPAVPQERAEERLPRRFSGTMKNYSDWGRTGRTGAFSCPCRVIILGPIPGQPAPSPLQEPGPVLRA
jgi:hypothetical protein